MQYVLKSIRILRVATNYHTGVCIVYCQWIDSCNRHFELAWKLLNNMIGNQTD